MGDKYTLTIDRTPHTAKPNNKETALITRRLQAAGRVTLTYGELADLILTGGTFCCGCYQPSAKGWGEFVGMQMLALDFDRPDVLDPMDALDRCERLHIAPLLLYFTFGATVDPWYPKYRLVFNMGELVTDEDAAHGIIREMLDVFPEADKQCSNVSRLFFGGREIIDCRGGAW